MDLSRMEITAWFEKKRAKLAGMAKPCSFFFQLVYFLAFSTVGFLALKISKPGTSKPKDLDLFFTSVSAVTVSSMSTVEMEAFSNTQLIIIALLMFLGGEVFTSMLALYFSNKFSQFTVSSMNTNNSNLSNDQIDSTSVDDHHDLENTNTGNRDTNKALLVKCMAIRSLAALVLGYLVAVHLAGSFSVFMYLILVQSGRDVLRSKGIPLLTFSVFTIISTFANCGFVPTNENMIVFRKNSGLLLLLFPQLLLGNTLYPCGLRLFIWVFNKIRKRDELSYILNNHKETGYPFLLSSRRSLLLASTVFGFIAIQLVLFCSLEWNSLALDAMNPYEKLVGSLFQVMNSRHAGESIVDLSIIPPAILVLFTFMMYLPPYTIFLPSSKHKKRSWGDEKKVMSGKDRRNNIVEGLMLSPLGYLVIFIILICITERQKLKEDPLNFSVLNITIEVVSAYGNVGFTTGYSCQRRLKPNGLCEDAWFGFVGRWSSGGKFILIIIMFFGRLKKFAIEGGKAWKLHV